MPHHLVRAATVAAVLAAAIIAGAAVVLGSALLEHEVLVRIYGEDLSPIDDTLLMLVAVALDYLAGFVTGLVVLAIGWRRLVRGPSIATGR